jgi:polyhydroxyalkanoate synthesis regulator phasin
MPKKKNQESQAEQSERFRNAVRDLVAAGELNPTEADEALSRMVGGQSTAERSRQDLG